jgi:hypothetical protein
VIDQLFGSKTRVKLLELFYSNPNRSFYVREITRKIEEQINSVRRELANLLNAGIIISETTDNKLYYEVNQQYEFYEPLAQIFGKGTAVASTTATKKRAPKLDVGPVDDDLKALGNVDLALYTGQFTRDESAGIDLLLVGNLNQNQVTKFVTELEQKEGKEIRYVILSADEFAYRQKINDRFIAGVIAAKKQILVDKYNVFE